jgi:hypothetical protein
MHYRSNDDESRLSTNTPVPSEDPASASSKSKKGDTDENYHLHVSKKMKVGCHVPCKSDQSQSIQKEKKGEKTPTLLADDLDFTDTVLMGLDSIDDAVLNGCNNFTNPFNFSK